MSPFEDKIRQVSPKKRLTNPSLALGDDQIISLVKRSAVVARIPGLRKYAAMLLDVKRGAGCCGKKSVKVSNRRDALNGIKTVLQHIGRDEAQVLKDIMNAEELVFYVRVNGKVERRTI